VLERDRPCLVPLIESELAVAAKMMAYDPTAGELRILHDDAE
jgi:hypothetical protein